MLLVTGHRQTIVSRDLFFLGHDRKFKKLLEASPFVNVWQFITGKQNFVSQLYPAPFNLHADKVNLGYYA